MPAERPNSSKGVRDLDPRAEAAQLEARGYTSDQIGERLGVPGSTVRNWRQEPKYGQRVSETRRAMFDAATGRAAGDVVRMVDVLVELAVDSRIEPQHRIRAASVVLDQAQKLRNHTDLEAEFQKLRDVVEGMASGGTP